MKIPLHLPKHHHTYRNQDTLFHRMFNDPYVDWGMILAGSIVVVSILISAGVYVYFRTDLRLKAAPEGIGASVPSLFDKATFDVILKEFDSRAIERARVLDGYSGIGDPSR